MDCLYFKKKQVMEMEVEPEFTQRHRHAPWKSPSRRSQQRSSSAAEAIEKLQGGGAVAGDEQNGVVRVKIILTKRELRQMVGSMGQRRSSGATAHHHAAAPQSVEQLLHVLQRWHTNKAAGGKGQEDAWRPALQSIPEEN